MKETHASLSIINLPSVRVKVRELLCELWIARGHNDIKGTNPVITVRNKACNNYVRLGYFHGLVVLLSAS